MSHIAEVYAKDLGVKIGRPHITDHFFPGLPDKYITVQSSSKMPAAKYKYWDIVLMLIKPYLQNEGIKIIQIGGPEEVKIQGIDYNCLGTTYKQMNYIIKKSLTHVGCDSLPGHIAGVYDTPSVILHFNLYPENSKPLWHKINKSISLSPDFSEKKPSFSTACDRINEIKAETIGQSVLDQLGIKNQLKFKTIKIGKHFHSERVEIVPNFFGFSEKLQGKPVNIRGDLHFDMGKIVEWCKMCIVNLHIDQYFDTEILNHLTNVKQIIFKYKDCHNDIDLNSFFNFIKSKKIRLLIVCGDKENIADVRFKYFDFDVIDDIEPEKEIKSEKFFSKKLFISNGETYSCESSANRLDKSHNFVYDEASSKELESLYLYEEK